MVSSATTMAAHFKKPSPGTLGPLGSYDTQSGSTSVWRVRLHEGQFGRVALTESSGLTVASNNPGAVPNEDAVFKQTTLAGGTRVIDFYGLSGGSAGGTNTAMLEARRADDVVTYMQIQVASIANKRAFFTLDAPSMALNASRTPVRYSMKYTETISGGTSPRDVLQKVADKSNLQHLVISCHGQPESAKGPYLELGSGFRDEDAALFEMVYPVVTNVIWFGACSIAGTAEGIDFCSRIARASGCFVVAPAITLPPMKAGLNQIEVFTRSMPHYFARDGKPMSPSKFLSLGSKLGFRMTTVS
jgi:hypothetical protein